MDQNNRILIIDDDEGVRETYAGIFSSEKKIRPIGPRAAVVQTRIA